LRVTKERARAYVTSQRIKSSEALLGEAVIVVVFVRALRSM
jgi:hypothetical protein